MINVRLLFLSFSVIVDLSVNVNTCNCLLFLASSLLSWGTTSYANVGLDPAKESEYSTGKLHL